MIADKKDKIVILIPCYNESKTIKKVITDFKRVLPEALIYVGDNNSSDETANIAKESGAIVISDKRQGKGNMIQTLFKLVKADYYIMVDGDDTYLASQASALLQPLKVKQADTTIGNRHVNNQYANLNSRKFHNFGNRLVINLINKLFNANLNDVMSGYRGFTKNYVKNLPILSTGFELETEMTLNTLENNFRIMEIPIQYQERPEGSFSKLNTFKDGYRVVLTIVNIFKDYRPFLLYSSIALIFFVLGLILISRPLFEYLEYNFVFRVPSLIAGFVCFLISLIFVNIALILDTQKRYHKLIMNHLIKKNV